MKNLLRRMMEKDRAKGNSINSTVLIKAIENGKCHKTSPNE